jgi:D-alanine-D-alanine ligase
MTQAWNIVVMRGGPSAEREVSLRSGESVANALRRLGHHVTEIDPQPCQWKLPDKTDVVFLALHGTYGEDGVIQGELEHLGVPYTGCGVEASRIAFDKVLTKNRCAATGVPVAKSLVVDSPETVWPKRWKPPVVLKPVRQGSSVGLQFVDQVEQWPAALKEALKHDSQVLVEPKIIGAECTVGILGDKILPVVEVRPRSGNYDYQSKYTKGATEYLCPAPFNAETTARIQAAAEGAFRAIGGRDYARVDVMVSHEGEPVVLEVNTLPGMTETSLLPKAAAAAGFSYEDLCQRIVELAMARHLAIAR